MQQLKKPNSNNNRVKQFQMLFDAIGFIKKELDNITAEDYGQNRYFYNEIKYAR